MIELRTPAELDGLRAAGRFVADVLDELLTTVDVGVDLLDLDQVAARMIADRGAVSCYVDYHPSFGRSPFGRNLCTSVNDAALHGLPHAYRLQDGDVVSMDFAASVDGWVADSAVTVQVGTPDAEDQRLIDTVERALVAGIAQARPGNKLGDVSHAIGAVAHQGGYDVNLQFGGHGVGRTMHGEPHVPNDGRPGRGLKLRPGLVVAIEPWLMRGTDELYQDDDGWTLKSVDGSRAAHVEHTVAVTEHGPEILTLRRAQRDQ
ncbi:type I methionyl aminopeptidase [Curtobacterium sp. VKM Ac-2922]|uniref:type I methionyl aminopeptidase n=1 Tax=Curtobacterium sp. VKM Ac-2922 TaxID=2929475 RepID=UPI001FB1DA8E|nr:type I methionyl aminopeptidase [Curtobacterium sp. VKM Ac-2922]MCJ1712653.1 type I methionyl aminopeptidase [Curtobacterium sp. VKM Ac-2922]